MRYFLPFLMIIHFQSCMLILATLTYPVSYITPSDSYHSLSFNYVYKERIRKIQLKGACTYYKKFSANIAGWSLESKSSVNLFVVPLEEGIYLLLRNSLCYRKTMPPILELNLNEIPKQGTSINTDFYKCGSNQNLNRIISWKTEKIKEKEFEQLLSDHNENKEKEFLHFKFIASEVEIYNESEWKKNKDLPDVLDKTTKVMTGNEYQKIKYPNYTGHYDFSLYGLENYKMYAKPEPEGWNLDHLSSEPYIFVVGENDPYNRNLLGGFEAKVLYKNETYLAKDNFFDPETRKIYNPRSTSDCF
ncbi:hypothetical protein [Leptospira perdikensis]|uniref:Uncharacterized protein n=1 Tax=Leptospira perdikensis TaxID=2484948 RepID=A0A4R9J4R4_9LEPT|nr:hypothetical protein [Leptospira perdikensis]TGL33499.1 hypothetical protein EHQ49_17880 [Leptospira perdikensis]